MRAGTLRERIRFDRRAPGQNIGGVVRGDWAILCGPFAAEKRPIRGYEQAAEARLSGREVFELHMRGCTAIRQVAPSDRAVDVRNCDPLTGLPLSFNILAIDNPDQRGREYVFTVESGGSDG